jgi:GntR family transcriptional regulator
MTENQNQNQNQIQIQIQIESESFVPKYHQVKQSLLKRIEFMAPHERVPSEQELCDSAGVSRTTARKALEELEHDGIIYRVQGRGSFVNEPAKPQRFHFVQRRAGMFDDVAEHGQTLQSIVLEQQVVRAPDAISRKMGISAEDLVIRLVRIRVVEGLRIMLTTTYIPHVFAPGLENEDLADKSLYHVLEEKYGLNLSSGTRTIEAGLCRVEESEHLGLAIESPILVVSAVMFDNSGHMVEYTEAKLRGDLARLEIQVSP